jgi:hypothetical protein
MPIIYIILWSFLSVFYYPKNARQREFTWRFREVYVSQYVLCYFLSPWYQFWGSEHKYEKVNIFRRGLLNKQRHLTEWGSRDSAVSIAAVYGLDDCGVGVRVPVRSRIFSSPHRPDWLWGPHSLLSNGVRFSPWGRAAGAWSWPPASN